jgi:hypothetical protein
MPYRRDGLEYLRMHPKLWRWMNRCQTCEQLGHKPELPDKVGEGVAADNLRGYFPALALNDIGICCQCEGKSEKTKG